MNSILWFSQILLAILFAYSGWMKSTRSSAQLVAMGQTGVEHLPTPLIRFIGVSELTGALGVIIPQYTQIVPVLTSIAALCLGLIMIPAGVIHYRRHENRAVWLNGVVLLLCLLVAYGRLAQLT